MGALVNVLEIVPFVRMLPFIRQLFGSGECFILYGEHGFMHAGRMIIEVGAYQLTIPSPVIFRVCSGMYTYKAAACLDVPFKISFLVIIQYIAGGVQEYYRGVLLQGIFGEAGCIFCSVYIKSVFLA